MPSLQRCEVTSAGTDYCYSDRAIVTPRAMTQPTEPTVDPVLVARAAQDNAPSLIVRREDGVQTLYTVDNQRYVDLLDLATPQPDSFAKLGDQRVVILFADDGTGEGTPRR